MTTTAERLRTAPAVGSLLMSFAVMRMKPWPRPGRLLLMVVVGFGLATIGFGLSKNFVLSLLCLSLVGATDTVSVRLASVTTRASYRPGPTWRAGTCADVPSSADIASTTSMWRPCSSWTSARAARPSAVAAPSSSSTTSARMLRRLMLR